MPLTRPPRRAVVRRRLLAAALVVAVTAAGVVAAGDPGGPTPRPTAGIGRADGFVPVGGSLSPFASVPAIDRLDPALRAAVRRAARAARADGIELRVASGWRSAAYQRALFDEALRRYRDRAAAWALVKPPAESSHVTGEAVDVAPTDAADWVIQHGSAYGLCQVYANELWHFERVVAPGGTCPATRPDAASG